MPIPHINAKYGAMLKREKMERDAIDVFLNRNAEPGIEYRFNLRRGARQYVAKNSVEDYFKNR